ncbi:MAG TPA: cytochrome-c peroxidase [Bacteroidetes bacterium]|nr:cytochrome-c peroxidase [Bacteroidota bacterium]
MKRVNVFCLLCFAVFFFVQSCKKDDEVIQNGTTTVVPTDTTKPFAPTPYLVQIPVGLPLDYPIPSPLDNPLTVEGVELGRKLFHDKILSKNNVQSCGSCHSQLFGFTDEAKQFSFGASNQKGERNSMPLFNLAYVEKFAKTDHRFFWDGGAKNLESQVLGPITNPLEMEETLTNVIDKLQKHPQYPALFKKAFGSDSITTAMLMKAIAQFERIIVSGETRFDYFKLFGDQSKLTAQEKRGLELFNTEEKADCFHCHSLSGAFMTDFLFHHNGHQSSDPGLGRITNNPEDKGKFRTPSLRNLVFTAPYMHDGRLAKLEDVVEFYNSGAIRTYPADPFITKHPNGLGLTSDEKADLVAFLKTMTDSTLITNTNY